MFQIRTFLLGCCAVSALAACGSGSSSDNTTNSSSSQPVSSSGSSSDDYSAVVGLYDVSNGDDEQYYYIAADGLFTAYNYLGDSVDNGNNCYREATGAEANAEITGQTLTAKADGNFAIDVAGTELVFEMVGGEISRLTTPQFSSGGSMYVTLNGAKVRITTNTTDTPVIADIQAMICN
ncbi:hypothetical protein [Gilvimarinus sp. 1_MG-2023]|uniref:hypothetical protein n=1 Tax=Gilvimarinus sp. 1_MG-2023 TaxID=3062638 RepID=UPI0026E367BD|nr:hypothetical protein [Gilvimarinus sp. 1_MG-2023]MDO6747014.1 hypothetical protein [Gilvimarinus sp. 1_MG-2023]